MGTPNIGREDGDDADLRPVYLDEDKERSEPMQVVSTSDYTTLWLETPLDEEIATEYDNVDDPLHFVEDIMQLCLMREKG